MFEGYRPIEIAILLWAWSVGIFGLFLLFSNLDVFFK